MKFSSISNRGFLPNRSIPRVPMIGRGLLPFPNYSQMVPRARNPRAQPSPIPINIEPKKPLVLNPEMINSYTQRDLGEKLYPMVLRCTNPNIVGKITGMLLEMEKLEIVHLINDEIRLQTRVKEAIEVLRKAWANDYTLLATLA